MYPTNVVHPAKLTEQEDVLVARASHLVETASSLLLSSKKEKEQSFEATGTWI